MALYRYEQNLSPNDRYTAIVITLDSGNTLQLEKGLTYDLSATERNRASQYVQLVASTDPVAGTDKIVQLSVIGDLSDGDVPVWSSAIGAFIPGSAGGSGNVVTTEQGAAELNPGNYSDGTVWVEVVN